MEGDKHFSHDHPLISFFEKNYDDVKDHSCHICGLPILSSPSYTCPSKTCNFFLHKPCSEFPENLSNHPIHDFAPHEDHNLQLQPSGKNFTYKCQRQHCEFHIHPLEIRPVEIKTMHKSHPHHPLVAAGKETLCRCDACAEEHKGIFFCCLQCNFWIHQDCTILPTFVRISSQRSIRHILHDLFTDIGYHFILTYSFNFDILSTSPPRCFICQRIKCLRQYDGIYFRGETSQYAHVSCAKPYMERVDTETARREIIQLPDEGDIIPSLPIRKFAETNPDFSVTQHDHYNEECHEHGLILHDNNNNNDNNSSTAREGLICDVCTQPIDSSSPFFRCKLLHCAFLVHTICANLHSTLVNLVMLQFERCYLITSNEFEFRLYRDELFETYNLECRLMRPTIQHASHPQHILSNVAGQLHHFQLSCCDPEFNPLGGRRIYRCVACEFYIHMRCALLPKRTRHKSDEHPLELITATTAHQLECCFCEFCEEDIDQRYWYYGCRKCEHYFHVKCIPSVGRLSRAKFGKTLDDSKIHRHPVAVTRMLTIGRHEKCHLCHQRIKGFEEETAFHCSECDFWTHFDCAHRRILPATENLIRIFWIWT